MLRDVFWVGNSEKELTSTLLTCTFALISEALMEEDFKDFPFRLEKRQEWEHGEESSVLVCAFLPLALFLSSSPVVIPVYLDSLPFPKELQTRYKCECFSVMRQHLTIRKRSCSAFHEVSQDSWRIPDCSITESSRHTPVHTHPVFLSNSTLHNNTMLLWF